GQQRERIEAADRLQCPEIEALRQGIELLKRDIGSRSAARIVPHRLILLRVPGRNVRSALLGEIQSNLFRSPWCSSQAADGLDRLMARMVLLPEFDLSVTHAEAAVAGRILGDAILQLEI